MQLQSSNRHFDFEKGEIFLLNKPYGWTSFNVISSLRYFLKHHFGIKKIKIGHSGTLDPLATGLLIVCTGKYTKKIEELQGLEKEYTGTITLGATTPSFDLEKKINHTFAIDNINDDLLQKTAKKFIGDITQTPPVYSAIKINGRKAYEYARNNEDIEIKSRLVNIKKFELIKIEYSKFINIDFRIVCSKGTYLRSLARDFGEALNNGAYLSALCRTRIGKYKLENAYSIDSLKKMLLEYKKQIR